MSSRVLQIVPHLPGTLDGVGDYALNLARALSADHGINTTFLVADKTPTTSTGGYAVVSGLNARDCGPLARDHPHVILHYVNYGYQARGVPFLLRAFAKQLRSQLRGKWVTTFHELYASGPPWKSAFWLRPFQVRIARDMIDASTACVVSNPPIENAISAYDPRKKIYSVPVMSNFGEPELADFRSASPKRWVICGGTALLARSLELFERLNSEIPDDFRPQHLDVVGGRKNESIVAVVDRLQRNRSNLRLRYYPEVGSDLASEVLRESSFGFIDYFGSGKVWPGMVLKSTAFAALCAHGVIPVLSHREPPIAVDGDALPGAYCVTATGSNLPQLEQVPEIRKRVYDWYRAHADSRQAARIYAEALK
ncbi:MAG TPA: hypothetical protein VGH00_06680 [Chthoniobacterales bacterium]